MGSTATLERTTELVDFKTLSLDEQIGHFHDVARRALGLWGYPEDSGLKLLNITENATFKVDSPEGRCMVMRVHRLDYAAKDSIRTEMAWLQALLEETDLNVVRPIPALDGTLVNTIATPEMGEERNVVCFEFETGKAPKDSNDDTEDISKLISSLSKVPKWITLPAFSTAAVLYERLGRITGRKDKLSGFDKEMYRTLGRIAATIHNQAAEWNAPDFYQRIEWDWEATFNKGWNNYYGIHYSQLKGFLSAGDIRAIDSCSLLMKKRLEAYGKASHRYGMIHSDLRLPNLLINGTRITVLDFDDSGKGWFMYDVACILGFMEHRADLRHLVRVIMEGYQEVRPVDASDLLELESFIMMRRIGLSQAILYHMNDTKAGSGESAVISPEILAFYAKGTAVLARKYIKKFAKLPLPASGEHK